MNKKYMMTNIKYIVYEMFSSTNYIMTYVVMMFKKARRNEYQ